MILFPAIDLIAGKVVRLERGDREHMKVYSDDPAAVARSFAEQGATWVHVVDLSAALEEDEGAREANTRAIEAICAVEGLSVDIGGGVRSLARIDELAALGCKRIALGTVLVREPGFAEVAARAFGGLLVADVAARDGEVKVNGWREGVSRSVEDVVGELSSLGFKHLVFTDIARWHADGHRCRSVPARGAGRRVSRRGVGRHLVARRYPRARGGGSRGNRGRYHGAGAV